LGLGLVVSGLAMAAGGTLSIVQGKNSIPDVDTRPAFRRSLDPRPSGRTLPVSPGISRFYAGTAAVGRLALLALGLLTLLGGLDRPTRNSPEFLFGLGLNIAAGILAGLSWELPGLHWIWGLLLAGGVFRIVQRIARPRPTNP